MRKLVDSDPISFELLDRCIRRRNENNRRAAASTYHPKDHLLPLALHGNDDEVHTVARKPAAE
jgi:hypothetical protein